MNDVEGGLVRMVGEVFGRPETMWMDNVMKDIQTMKIVNWK
jgi:hypothetical protein